MNKLWRGCWLIGLILMAAMFSSSLSRAGSRCAGDYAPGVVLVGLRDGVRGSGAGGSLSTNHAVSRLPPEIGAQALRVPAGEECAMLETLRRDPRVAYAELDYAVRATDVITPNDPGWPLQWGPAKIGAPAAWSIVTGTPDVVIAVLDTGIYLEHEDLSTQLWINAGEIPGNWMDDDGNGKVDDVHGWHFYHYCNNGICIPYEDADARDDNGHGTHVAGIAAAATTDSVGIAGLAWGARIMPVKVLNQYGDGFYSDLAAGIVYAAENGARIINMSLGGAEPSQTLCAAVDYARWHGALVVSATGNDGAPWIRYPAACPGVLAVAATDSNDQRAQVDGRYFSNYGPQVDLAAPGQDIYSTWCHQNIYLKLCDGNYYLAKSGTSMATPHVSGVAALIWSRWPTLTADAVARQITQTVDDVVSPGWDEYTGWGRLNAAAAVTTLTVPADLWIHVTAPTHARPGQVITYALQYGNGGGDARDVWITATLSGNLAATIPLTHHEPVLTTASDPYTLTIAAMVSSDVPPGVELTCTAAITSVDIDLNLLDNTTQVVTRVEYLAFLPVVLKE
jgi:subtilisin family serine protease